MLEVTVDEGHFVAKFSPSDNQVKSAVLNVALLGMDIENYIGDGENARRTLAHDFVVLNYKLVDSSNYQWQSSLPEIDPSLAQKLAIAFWVSEPSSLVPVQATGGWYN